MEEKWSIDVSQRLQALPPYVFGRLNALIGHKRADGVDIIDLGMGSPIDPPAREIVDALADSIRAPLIHRYNNALGEPDLREEVAGLYKRLYDVSLDPDTEVLALVGSKEGFSHFCLAMLGPGDSVILGDPYFPIHLHAPALAGAKAITVELGNDQAFLDRVAKAVDGADPKPKCLILNYPHNPTAITVDPGFFDRAVELADDAGMIIIHDMAYGRTCFDGYKAPSFLQARGAKELGVEFITMSKPYNMAGWRLGFCVGNAEMIRALAKIKGYYDYGVFTAIQRAGAVALRDCDQAVAQQSKVYQARRDAIVAGLRRIGWTVDKPRGSMFVWARVPSEHLGGADTVELSLRLIEEANVAVTPGGAFGVNGRGCVRVALVDSVERIEEAMGRLDRALNAPTKA